MAVSPGPGGDQAQGASLGDTLVDSVTMSQTDVDGVVIIGDPGFVKSVDQSLLDLKKLTTSPIRIQSIETKDYKVDQYFKYRLAYTAGMPIFLLTSLTLEKVRNLFYEFFAFSTHEVGDGNEWLSKDTSDAVGVKAKMILCNNHKVSMNSQFFKGFIQWASSMVKQDDSLPVLPSPDSQIWPEARAANAHGPQRTIDRLVTGRDICYSPWVDVQGQW